MKKKLFLLFPILMLLTGCAEYKSDYDQYALAYTSHQEKVTTAITSLSATSSYAVNGMQDPTARALYMILTQQQISQVANSSFQLVKPTTWTDFWARGWQTVETAVPFIGIGYVANQAFKNIQGTQISGETINLSDSFNQVESHVTGSSESMVEIPLLSPTTTTITTP